MPRDTGEVAIHICITTPRPISSSNNIFITSCHEERHKVDGLQVAAELWDSREYSTFTMFQQREAEEA